MLRTSTMVAAVVVTQLLFTLGCQQTPAHGQAQPAMGTTATVPLDTIAFNKDFEGQTWLCVISSDGSGFRKLQRCHCPTGPSLGWVSPGHLIYRDDGNLFELDLKGGGRRQVTFEGKPGTEMETPECSFLQYNAATNLLIYSVSLTSSYHEIVPKLWFRDLTTLQQQGLPCRRKVTGAGSTRAYLWQDVNNGDTCRLVCYNLADGTETTLLEEEEGPSVGDLTPSPDGNYAVFDNGRGIKLVDPRTKEIKTIGQCGAGLCWSASGHEIAYVDRGSTQDGPPTLPSSIWITDTQGERRLVLRLEATDITLCGWTSDNHLLYRAWGRTTGNKGKTFLYAVKGQQAHEVPELAGASCITLGR